MDESTRAMRKSIIDRDIMPLIKNRLMTEISSDDLRYLCNKAKVRCFFFTSRSRHTRSDRDWSSDVCSSDLRIRHRHPRPELHIEREKVVVGEAAIRFG